MNSAGAKHIRWLLEAGVAGTSTSHGGENNVHKLNTAPEQDSSTTFGMEELLRGAGFEEAYAAVAHQLGYPPTTRRTRDGGA